MLYDDYGDRCKWNVDGLESLFKFRRPLSIVFFSYGENFSCWQTWSIDNIFESEDDDVVYDVIENVTDDSCRIVFVVVNFRI